jgi:hypothetical protein
MDRKTSQERHRCSDSSAPTAALAGAVLLIGAACSSNDSPAATANSGDSATAAPTQGGSPSRSGDELTAEEVVQIAEPSVVRIATNSAWAAAS